MVIILSGIILINSIPFAAAPSSISSYETSSGGNATKSTNYRIVTSSVGGIGGTASSSSYAITAGWLPGTVAGNGFDLASSNLGTSVLTFATGPPPTTTIAVPSTVTNPTISFSNVLTGLTVPITNQLTIVSTLPDFASTVVISANTIITAPGGSAWNGILQLPVETGPISVLGKISSANPGSVIFLGLSGFDLTVSKPVKIFLPTTSSKAAFVNAAGTANDIPTGCNGDDVVTEAAQLVGNLKECFILVSGGIDIWTNHFSTFFSYASVVGGNNGNDFTAPTFTGQFFKPTEYPLTINGNHFLLPSFSNTVTATTITTGTPVRLQLLAFDNAGPSAIAGVVLYANTIGSQGAPDSDTYIAWNQNQSPTVHDPNGFFSSVKLTNTVQSDKMLFTFDLVFTKPMQKPNLVIRAWNQAGYSMDTIVTNAWQVVAGNAASPTTPTTQPTTPSIQQPTTPSTQQPTTPSIQQPTTPTTTQNAITQPQASSSDVLSAVKDWGGYSSHPITDSEFLKAMNINDASYIPSWVSKTTKWVADGSVSTQEFQAAISYLHQTHAIK